MFVGVEGGEDQVAVHIGPGADADGVEGVVVEELGPVVVGLGDFVLVGDALGGLAGAVGDGGDLDAGLLAEAGDVAEGGVGAGADEADAEVLVGHWLAPCYIM